MTDARNRAPDSLQDETSATTSRGAEPLTWETPFIAPKVEAAMRDGRHEVVVFGITVDGRIALERSWTGPDGKKARAIESPPRSPRYWPSCACGHPRVAHRERAHDGSCRSRGCPCELYELSDE